MKTWIFGDRVIGLVISKLLNLSRWYEGVIDKKFSNLVNKKTCKEIANNYLKLY